MIHCSTKYKLSGSSLCISVIYRVICKYVTCKVGPSVCGDVRRRKQRSHRTWHVAAHFAANTTQQHAAEIKKRLISASDAVQRHRVMWRARCLTSAFVGEFGRIPSSCCSADSRSAATTYESANRYPSSMSGPPSSLKIDIIGAMAGWLEFNVPFQHRYGYNYQRRHRSNGDCLEGKRKNYQVCSVQYCVEQLCTVQCTHI